MPKTILLGLDGLDWQLLLPLMERGELPAFSALNATGVTGNLNTLEPTLSPILWNSIATGKRAGKHGILGFTEVDDAGRVRPVSSLSRRCKAVWNILQQNGARCHVLNWFASHPAEPLSGSYLSDFFAEGATPLDQPWPLRRGTVHPERLAETLAEFRMSPDEFDGELLRLFVPRAAEVDQAKDKRLFVLARELAKALSVHNAATWLLQNEEWDFMAAYWRTPDLLFHFFMPYHPPAIEGTDPLEADIYGEVVNGVCRFYDQMLATYMALAGPDANIVVVSDHGFRNGPRRPPIGENPFANPEAWHRPQGVLLMKGPDIKPGDQITGARLLDIAPTVLTLHGVAPARDMDGRVLAEAFVKEPELDYIDTWETVAGETGQHPPGTKMDAIDAADLIQQFVDLGYIESLSDDAAKAAEQTRETNRWSLARDYLDAGRPLAALPLLEELHHAHPGAPELAHRLASVQKQLGLVREAEQTLGKLMERLKPGIPLKLLQSELALERKEYGVGLQILTKVAEENPNLPGLQLRLARTYMGLNRWYDAQRAFENVLAEDPENALACQGLAHVHLRQRFWKMAGSRALEAVGLQHNLPLAHFYLALALERLGHREPALDALRTAIAYFAGFVGARRALVQLLSKAKTPEADAEIAEQKQIVAAILEQRHQREAMVEAIRKQAGERAAKMPLAADALEELAPSSTAEREPTEMPFGEPCEFVLVSGLPRSGTSLMMQMLQAGGVPLQIDGERTADPDNTEGYFEWEPIKTLSKDPRIIEQANGRAIKIITMLLPALPLRHRYKVLFMQRPVEEVAASQHQMLKRRFPARAHAKVEKMEEALSTHRAQVLQLLQNAKSVELLEVPYPDLVRNPNLWAPRISEFLGARWPTAVEKMAAVVKPELYRQRSPNA